jgi:hypothetical protein
MNIQDIEIGVDADEENEVKNLVGHGRGMTQHKMTMETTDQLNTWNSCCMTMDKRAVQFFSQMAIIMMVMSFCIYQLINLKDPNDQATYLGLLNVLLGVLLPAPSLH